MAKHLVSCVACGKQFDANLGGRYDPQSRRYTCPECAGAQKDAAVAALAKKLKRQMILKIVFGILFIISGLTAIGAYDGITVALCIIIGAALLAWALIPYFKAKKQFEGMDNGET